MLNVTTQHDAVLVPFKKSSVQLKEERVNQLCVTAVLDEENDC